MENYALYLVAAGAAFIFSFGLAPLARMIAVKHALDRPSSEVKTHKIPTPLLGGVSIAAAFFISLGAIRLLTHFPTGTLYNLRGIFIGGAVILIIGIVDDLKKPRGLSVGTKFFLQAIAAAALAYYGVRMRFVEPAYISLILSFVWVIGVCNALNIIDIMDGLSASQAAIGSLGFLLVALPSEMVYVNFAAAALMGATLGFLPHNFSQRRKIFMGDSGSLFLGFIMAALAMGARYDHKNPLGVYAPLLILAVPIYDTFFVAIMRIARGESPFQGSKDHFALRLEKAGLSRRKIVALSALVSLVLTACAALVTKLPLSQAAWIYAFAAGGFFILSLSIAKIKMHDES